MARDQKTASSDGMTLLALAPFPAFNPWNWWALTSSRNAMLASLKNTHLALDAWRAGVDSIRSVIRLQQDEMLRILSAEIEDAKRASAAEAADGAASEAEDADAAASIFVKPMIEATRAYGQVGRAFIVAQRDTLRAFAEHSDRPH